MTVFWKGKPMKQKFIGVIPLVVLLGMLYNSCKDTEPTGPGGGGTASTTATLIGTVKDSRTSTPVNGAIVNLTQTNKNINENDTTGIDGSFSFIVNLGDTVTLAGTLTVTKSGYKQKVAQVSLQPGKPATIPDVAIDRDTTTGVGGGGGTTYANTIALIGTSETKLAVYGVGGTETAIITYEARDSLGFPIDIIHSDTVRFTLNPTGFGGAYISPTRAVTNAAGRVAVTLNSGTVSGTVQVVAEMNRRGGGIIQSQPVRIVINAGLPDQAHFSVAPQLLNFAAYDWLGRTNTITAQIGDKYSNPVQPGTSIYFSTTGGIIQAAGFTSPNGQASVTLYSGNPRPRDPTLTPSSLYGDGTGYAWVRGSTIGQGGQIVSDSVLTLFSGRAQVNYSVLGPDINRICFLPAGEQSVYVKISDENGNPLTAGTSVSTSIDLVADSAAVVKTSGLPTAPFDDIIVRGPGRTDFYMRVYDASAGGAARSSAFFTIHLTVAAGLNGSASVDIPGRISTTTCP